METRPTILIVDDERFNINVLSELLKPNYKIMVAINGEQALKAAKSSIPPDLILLDIMMPEMDGYEVCQHLKAKKETKDSGPEASTSSSTSTEKTGEKKKGEKKKESGKDSS